MQHKLAQLRVLVPQQTETGQRSTQASQPVMLRTHARQQATEPKEHITAVNFPLIWRGQSITLQSTAQS